MRNQEELEFDQYRADQEEIVGAIIKTRERLGLGQEWVAENSGYSVTQYIRIENGEREVTYEDLLRIGTVMSRYQDLVDPAYKMLIRKLLYPLRAIVYRVGYFFFWINQQRCTQQTEDKSK